MRIKITVTIFIALILLSCANNEKEKYVQVYKDMHKELLKYVGHLEKIKKLGRITPELKQKIFLSQKKIIAIRNSADSYSKEFDNNVEVRKKLRKTLINITIANYYIKRLQEKIRHLPGVKQLFAELRTRGG